MLSLAYYLQATFFDDDMTTLQSLKGTIIVDSLQYDPFSPYFRQYVEWDVLARDIVVIRADYINKNCLVATLSNPNGDGTNVQVKNSMIIPMPNGQYATSNGVETTLNPSPFTYVSVGSEQIDQ